MKSATSITAVELAARFTADVKELDYRGDVEGGRFIERKFWRDLIRLGLPVRRIIVGLDYDRAKWGVKPLRYLFLLPHEHEVFKADQRKRGVEMDKNKPPPRPFRLPTLPRRRW